MSGAAQETVLGQGKITEQMRMGPGEGAALSMRAQAALWDLLIRTLPFLLMGGAAMLRPALAPWVPIALLSTCAITAMVDGVLLVRFGQSLGKRIVGLRIVGTDGRAVGASRILLMRTYLPWLLVAVPYLGLLWLLLDHLALFGMDRRAVHDLLADTQVIRVR